MSENQKGGKSGVLTTTMGGVEAVSKEEIEEILKKVDKESDRPQADRHSALDRVCDRRRFSIFQVYTAAFGLLPAQLQRSVHLSFAFVLVYLLFPFAGFQGFRIASGGTITSSLLSLAWWAYT